MRTVGLSLLVAFISIGTANAEGVSGPLASAARAQVCAKTHESDYYASWVKNRCHRAPFGPRYEYLLPAWNCLCLGQD